MSKVDPHLKVIAFSMFRPADGKNDKAYKYADGALGYAQLAARIFPDWVIRVYYDRSLYDRDEIHIWEPVLEQLKRQKNVQLVEFTCPRFMIDTRHHIGLFGTVTRFMSLLDSDVGVLALRDIENIVQSKI